MKHKKVVPITQPSYFHKREPIIREHIARCVAAAILGHHIAELFEITDGVDKKIRGALRVNLVHAPAEMKAYEFYDNFWSDQHRLDLSKMVNAMTRASEEFEEFEDNAWKQARRERHLDNDMEAHIEDEAEKRFQNEHKF